MTDPHKELAELAAEVRAWVEDASLRGALLVDPRASLPVAEAPPEATAPAQVAAPPREVVLTPAWSQLASSARVAAERALDSGDLALERVQTDLGDCRRCNLFKGRRSIVFGVGSGQADLLIIGEAPGFHEDRTGEPFVGDAGQMLDKMLVNVLGLQRSETYICNIVKCRPPDNRNPLPDEVDACMPFLLRQVQAVSPKVILVLGGVALKTLFATDQGIMQNRGKWREYRGIPVMPTLHPAYLLRNPEAKRKVFEDLQQCRARYDELGGRRSA